MFLFAHGLGAGGDVLCICSTYLSLLIALIAGGIGLWKNSVAAASLGLQFSVLVGIVAIVAVNSVKPPPADNVYESDEAWGLLVVCSVSILLPLVAFVRIKLHPNPSTLETDVVASAPITLHRQQSRTDEETAAAVARFKAARNPE